MAALPKADRLAPDEVRLIVDEPLSLDTRDDLDEVVPQLPAQAFVQIARNLRQERRTELLLAHASPEQLTSLFDLDTWSAERIDVARARTWLTAISDSYQVAGRDRGALANLMYQMDPEMWTVALVPGTVVILLDPDRDESRDDAMADLGDLFPYETPDGMFVVGVPDDEQGRMAAHVIDRIYRDSLADGRKLLLAIHSAMFSQMEEDLLRWRSGRLADLGFVEWEDAMKLFKPLARDAALDRTNEDQGFVPDLDGAEHLITFSANDLLRRIMARLDPEEHGIRSRQFLLLVNEVMAAQRFDPGDEALQRRAIDQAQATVELGMQMLAAARPGHPDIDGFLAERVRAIGLRDVFRVGYGALDKLRQAALTLHREGRVSLERVGSLLDRPWGPAVAELSSWYPELPLESRSSGTRPLRSLRDVARATELVAQAGALAGLTFHPSGFAVDPTWIARADEPARLTLGDLVRTAVVHAHLPGSTTALAPLTQDDLLWARDNLVVEGHIAGPVRDDFMARARDVGVADHAEAIADNVLVRLAVELASLELVDGRPDLTKVGGLLTIQSVGMWLATTHGAASQ